MSDPSKEADDFATRFSGWHYSLGWGDGEDSVAPFVPTPLNVVRRMLELVKAGAGMYYMILVVVMDVSCLLLLKSSM
jgi:hypothetical protein